jgi:hypothetical protein
MANPTSFPSILKAQIFPCDSTVRYPEQKNSRYQPASHPFGVCFSGGGPRSFSASLGQMRGLINLGLIDSIGAISCVSGGTWFGAMFSYAPNNIKDSTLLGLMLDPGQITLDNLAEINPLCIGTPITNMNNRNILASIAKFISHHEKFKNPPLNHIYSRMLNDLMLSPFQLDSEDTFFSLDAETIQNIVCQNPALKASNFYTMRPNRPYFIAGATQIYPEGRGEVLRHFEYTPLYTGTPQLFNQIGPGKQDFGGGYVESFAFDTQTPSMSGEANYLTAPTPDPIFLLSDVMGSSGAAPGIIMDFLKQPELFPEFNYWPVIKAGQEPSTSYSFVDGGNLENTGIVPLLRRQYPVILAFVNSDLPIGSNSSQCIDGISAEISQLFGLTPKLTLNKQNIQIFETDKFAALAQGLKDAKSKGKPTCYCDQYTIKPDNQFGIPSYPGTGEVTVTWFYNDINAEWKSQLSPSVQGLLNSTDKTNYLLNFPNYKTVCQNKDRLGIDELLLLTSQQINLLAHMWCYTVINAGQAIRSLLR